MAASAPTSCPTILDAPYIDYSTYTSYGCQGSSRCRLCIFPIPVPFLLYTENYLMSLFLLGQHHLPAEWKKGWMPTGKLLHMPPSVREPLEQAEPNRQFRFASATALEAVSPFAWTPRSTFCDTPCRIHLRSLLVGAASPTTYLFLSPFQNQQRMP